MSPMSPRLRILLSYDYFAKLEFAYIRQDVRTTIIIIIQTDRLCAAKSLSLGLAQARPNYPWLASVPGSHPGFRRLQRQKAG